MSEATSPVDALRELGVADDTYGPTVNTTSSPDVDILGESLAERLAESRIATLAIWNTVDEAVLGHSIAHYLGSRVRRASELEGILTFSDKLDPGSRVALVATQWTGRRLASLRSLVSLSGAKPVAVAAVLHSPAVDEIDDIPKAVLISPRETEEFTS